mmetsp:Transcript_7831/g.14074  ORF Transcript_7831/g.14074 Transcript_7831/m.14074 type:complete len:169 (+) Transcript_7831:3-509(+)
MIGEMKTSNPFLTKRILRVEGFVYNGLGFIALGEETKESIKTAVEYFGKHRDISKAIGNDVGVNVAEQNIVLAKSIYGGGSKVCNEETLEKSQEWYKHLVEKYGEESQTTVTSGMNLAVKLDETNRAIEAERLRTKLAAVCKRVYGPDHGLTKEAESDLQASKVKLIR